MSHLHTEDDRGRRIKEQRPPARVAVFTLYYSTVGSACVHAHRIALCLSDRSSSSDTTSIVGGALARPFQPLRNEIDHHTPPCTALVGKRSPLPSTKAAKALLHRDHA